ncbi:MAG: WD40 repeat domain-containing protein [Leptolyngbya sp. BL-A-14]
MTHPKYWQLFGIVFAIALSCIVGSHYFFAFERQLAARIPHGVCVSSLNRPTDCYTLPRNLSSQATTALAISPDGQVLASSQKGTIRLWNLQLGKRQRSLRGHTDWVTALAFSPDGSMLASSSLDRTIKLWNLTTGELLQTFLAGRMTCLRFSPDGQTLVVGSRISRWADGAISPGGIQRWDLTTGQALPTIGSDHVAALAFSRDGQTLASGLLKTQLWNVGTGQLIHTLDTGEVTSLVFDQNDQTLISASSRTKFWQVSSGALLQTLPSSSTDLALSPDGQILAASSGGTINLWQLETRKLLGTLRGSVYSGLSIAFGLEGTIISGSSDGIKVWQPSPPPFPTAQRVATRIDR